MKRIGLIGGIGPASTIEYYKLIIKLFKERVSTDEYPEFLLHSINMTEMLDLVFQDRLEDLVELLKQRIQVLEASGVHCVALASNTPHLVFDQLAEAVQVELISIVEATCQYIAPTGIQKVGLLGTQSTMSKGFYQTVGQRYQLDIVIPPAEHQRFVHEKYMKELVFNQINPHTKQRLLQIVHEMERDEAIEGIILGGTELPLILQQEDFDRIKVFDTTFIHVQAILDRMMT
ncbi:MAG: amino acid racemase [Bacteroidota bacterium]